MRITSRIASALIVSALAHSAVVNAATIEASVVVIVCDYAGVGKKNVADAERTVSRIYRKAGVDIQWVDACNAGEGPALRLNMIATTVAADGPIAESALGYAAAATGIANIRLDRIIATSVVRHTCARDAMGPVIAHELGHLLLGPGAHTGSGIMQASFDRGSASVWGRAFSREQVAQMVRTINTRNQRFLIGS